MKPGHFEIKTNLDRMQSLLIGWTGNYNHLIIVILLVKT